MNRERLKILRDHLAGLPDERVDMQALYNGEQALSASWSQDGPAAILNECGTVACVAGWALYLFAPTQRDTSDAEARDVLGIASTQAEALFCPPDFYEPGLYTRVDAIAAIDSMLANPEDDALPVWPKKAVSA